MDVFAERDFIGVPSLIVIWLDASLATHVYDRLYVPGLRLPSTRTGARRVTTAVMILSRYSSTDCGGGVCERQCERCYVCE